MLSLQAHELPLPRRSCMHKISASHVSEGRCCRPHRQDVEITAGLTGASDICFYFAPKAAVSIKLIFTEGHTITLPAVIV